MSDLLTPSEVAARLGVTPRTVQRWIRDGVIEAVSVGKRHKVPSSALQRPSAAARHAVDPGSGRPSRLRPIRRVLIANRGELVVRIARTCRIMGIATLALAPDDQRDMWWVRAADEVVPLPTDYLDGPSILASAIAAGADAIHPGYGFLAERPDFAEAVIAAGLTWIGPPASAMRALGDKAAARKLAVGVGVPILPGYDGRGQSDAVLRREAARIGYPVLVKPTAGGGGMGMHVAAHAPRPSQHACAGAPRGDAPHSATIA